MSEAGLAEAKAVARKAAFARRTASVSNPGPAPEKAAKLFVPLSRLCPARLELRLSVTFALLPSNRRVVPL